MSDAPPEKVRTGVIWAVLALLLLFGTVASAFFVFNLLDLLGPGPTVLEGVIAVAAAAAAVYCLMLIAGILYRIDRLRGVPHKRVELFE